MAAPKAAANIDALLALQGVEEDPIERRKRSVPTRQGWRSTCWMTSRSGCCPAISMLPR